MDTTVFTRGKKLTAEFCETENVVNSQIVKG